MNLLKALLLAAMPLTVVCDQSKNLELTKEKEVTKELTGFGTATKTNLLSTTWGDSKFTFKYYNRSEAFYSRSLNLFSPSQLDQIFYAQTTNDFNLFADINNSCMTSSISIRNKGRWGNPTSIAKTTDSGVRIANTTLGSHGHAIPRQILWIREGWVNLSLNKVFCIKAEGDHYFRFGAFPFELGRGIALGSAYAVAPGILGFFNSNVIDQYANGILFGGDIFKNRLSYGVYAAMLENQSDRLDNNLFPAFAQEIGRRENPWRGFGQINVLFASKLTWAIKDPIGCTGKLTIEPYGMINNAPEQRVEAGSDAKSKLGTIGISCDYKGSCIDWGFDLAGNLGHQTVRPWDRNEIEIRSLDGVLTEVYSDVYSDAAKTTNAVVTDANKSIVNKSQQSVNNNGKVILGSTLYNADTRFRPGYKNHYKGFMFVADMAGWVYKKELKLAGTVAFATGDENPNKDLSDPLASNVDGDFAGFIGLQEIYSGKQVKSVMVLSAAAIPRPMTSPFNNRIPRKSRFAHNVSGFSNLVFFGVGADWSPECWRAKFKFRPNVLAFWQEKATKKFDAATKFSTDQNARKFLGVEVNGFFTLYLNKNLNAFVTAGVFVPGAHFKDIQGRPLNKAQIDALEAADKTGFTGEVPPVLGTKRAIMLNWGLEYNF